MKIIKIHSPIWNTRSIGIAEHKLSDNIRIEIDYKTKDNKRLFPGKYTLSREKALSYPKQRCGYVTLRIIPIDDLEPIKAPPRRRRVIKEEMPEINEMPGARGGENG